MSAKNIELGPLAFHWRMSERPHEDSGLPTTLPFTLGFREATQLIVQESSPQLSAALQQAYRADSNLGYMQVDHALADRYGQDFLAFIGRMLPPSEPGQTSILDVGCGGGYLLRALQERRFRVFGIDPGPLASSVGARLGIPMLSGFYPCPHGFGPMDVVLSSGVLEHVPDPIEFLRAHQHDLTPSGMILISTPDNQGSLDLGDPSMLMHEHISYFDAESLRRVVEEAGYEVVALEAAGYGQTLYCCARRSGRTTSSPASGIRKFAVFSERLQRSLKRFEAHVMPLLRDPGVDLGFYVPLRALPYLSYLRQFAGYRFFDDDPGVRAKYFDGFDVSVENLADLMARPPTHVVVMSLPHARVIEARIGAALGDRVSVETLERLLAD